MEYTGITTVATGEDNTPAEPGAINGGMMKRSDKVRSPVVVINVASVNDYLGKVEAGGGSQVMPKTEIPGMGYYAYVSDPEGNIVGIWENLQS